MLRYKSTIIISELQKLLTISKTKGFDSIKIYCPSILVGGKNENRISQVYSGSIVFQNSTFSYFKFALKISFPNFGSFINPFINSKKNHNQSNPHGAVNSLLFIS